MSAESGKPAVTDCVLTERESMRQPISFICYITLTTALAHGDPLYNATYLGSIPGYSVTQAAAINNSGQITGTASGGSCGGISIVRANGAGLHSRLRRPVRASAGLRGSTANSRRQDTAGTLCEQAFLWNGGTLTGLGTIAGGAGSFGNAINDSGQIAGTLDAVGDCPEEAFLYSNGAISAVGFCSVGMGVNNSGQVAGEAFTSTAWGYLYSNGSTSNLGDEDGPNAVNNNGQVAGNSDTFLCSSYPMDAVLWSEGTVTCLGTVPGWLGSEAFAINNSGQVAGDAIGADTWQAFEWSSGTMTAIGFLPGYVESLAYGINDAGQVVGMTTDGLGDWDGFLYSGGVTHNLNTLAGLPEGTLIEAVGINNSGQIVANSWDGAYLLNPVQIRLTAAPTKVVTGANSQFSLTATTATITGSTDGVYSWEIVATQDGDNPTIAQLPDSPPSCNSQTTCTVTIAASSNGGKATLRVHLKSPSNGQDEATVHGCPAIS